MKEDKNEINEEVEKGIKLYLDNKFLQSKEVFEKYPENPKALYHLGLLYHHQKQVELDYSKAKKYFEKANEKDEKIGIGYLGYYNIYGSFGIERNEEKAMKLFKKGIELKDPDTYYLYGLVLIEFLNKMMKVWNFLKKVLT
jgi:TPR repeat protein